MRVGFESSVWLCRDVPYVDRRFVLRGHRGRLRAVSKVLVLLGWGLLLKCSTELRSPLACLPTRYMSNEGTHGSFNSFWCRCHGLF